MMNLGGIHIRRRLLFTTFLPLVAALLVSWLIGVWVIAGRIEDQAQETARSNLNTVRELYRAEEGHLAEGLQLIGRSTELARAISESNQNELSKVLGLLSGSRQYDFLTVVDLAGNVRFRSANPGRSGDSLRHLKPIQDALSGRIAEATMLMMPGQTELENPALPELITIKLKETPRALPSNRLLEQRGLFLVAAAPIKDFRGNVNGALWGGVLLNNNQQLADRITQTISPEKPRDGEPAQAVTIFLDDVRIATTVTDANGQRATGTRMSAEVARRVLQEGKPWLDRAFVLRENYFAAYEPLKSPTGEVIGALYVGLPERPYKELRRNLNLLFLAVLLAVSLLALALTTRLGQLLTSREEEVSALNKTLEQKVLERTAQLEEKTGQLLEKEKELARSERLAELGMLSAGVAHEINNPLAIIRGNAELLQMAMQPEAESQEEVSEILTQVGRINRIVGSLLSLARQEQRSISRFSLNQLLDEILDQIGHQVSLEGYEIEKGYLDRDLTLEADREQMRQVFTNLIVNGLQAMENGGSLTISSGEDQGRQVITVTDTGPGIPEEMLDRLFTPFFTTKQNGTGLGLAVSWGIVRNHGGQIEVHTLIGKGTGFAVNIPAKA